MCTQSSHSGRGVLPTFKRSTFKPSNDPLVPLQPNALGATIGNDTRNLYDPGKQHRSSRCLMILSGHRESFDEVPGHGPTWSGSQVDRFAIVLARRPGSTVLTLDRSRVARITHPCRMVSGPASARDAGNFGPERPAVSDWARALSWGRDEADLVHELQAGSETAFDWLVTHYHAPVYNLILGMLGDTSDAADSAQEVFLKAFRGIRNFRQGSSLKTWLYRIAIREALNHKRWFKRHVQKNVSIDAEPQEGQARIEIEDLGATPFDQLAVPGNSSRRPSRFAAGSRCLSQRGDLARSRRPELRGSLGSSGMQRWHGEVPHPSRAPRAEGNS